MMFCLLEGYSRGHFMMFCPLEGQFITLFWTLGLFRENLPSFIDQEGTFSLFFQTFSRDDGTLTSLLESTSALYHILLME